MILRAKIARSHHARVAGWLECTRPAVTAHRSGSPTPPRLGGTWQQADATIAAAMAETGEDVLVIGDPRAGNVPMYEREGRKHVLRRMLAEVAEVAEAIGWVLNAGWKVRPLSSKPLLFAGKRR